ncbi:extracellular solute-binding protein [Kribbella sp. NPDC050124]|uniref:extracellular solute-binding protein n=1 Tax=Kribbella sp. NPDC050124 TaxID=3364114 RepID=UPI0037B34515
MSTSPIDRELSRRTALRTAAIGGSALAFGVPSLAACSNTGAGPTSAAGKQVTLPTYRPPTGLKPDLAGDPAQGIQDGFFTMPADLQNSVDGNPMSGGEISAMVPTLAPPPPPLSSNTYAQAMNARLGGRFTVRTAPSSEYGTKIDTLLAGNDLPDLVLVQDFGQPRLDKLLENKFTDVSGLLSGDKVLEYPNLAAIPARAWTNAGMFGRLWGVPIERPLLWNVMMARADLMDAAGAAPGGIATTDDFEAMCAEVNDPRRNRWALTGSYGSFSLPAFAAAFGAPNNWRKNSDGSFTRDWETDEYKAAVEFTAKLRRTGYFHPQSANLTGSQITKLFVSGQIACYAGQLSAWRNLISMEGLDASQVTAMPLFGAKGKQPAVFYGTGVYGVLLLKKASEARAQECLRLLDFYAAPFGTKEYVLVHYGVAGADYELQNGQPKLTLNGKKEVVNVGYVSGSEFRVMYSPGLADWVRDQYQWEKAAAPHGLADPTLGLYSETASRSGDEDQKVRDTISDVVMGRKKLDDFSAAVKTWKTAVGDKIRDEYAKQHG